MSNIHLNQFVRKALPVSLFCVLSSLSLLAATVVSGQVSVTHTGFGRHHTTGVWSATMTVTNKTGADIAGPVEVVLTSLPAGVVMVNNSKLSGGSPVVVVSAGSLAKGASAKVMIQFTNPSNDFISFTPITYSGGL